MTPSFAIISSTLPCHLGDQNTNSQPIVSGGPARFSPASASASLATNQASIARPSSPGRLRSPLDLDRLTARSRCVLIFPKRKPAGGASRARELSAAVAREYTGRLPSWIIGRIEAKVAQKQAGEDSRPARARLIKGKWREK